MIQAMTVVVWLASVVNLLVAIYMDHKNSDGPSLMAMMTSDELLKMLDDIADDDEND